MKLIHNWHPEKVTSCSLAPSKTQNSFRWVEPSGRCYIYTILKEINNQIFLSSGLPRQETKSSKSLPLKLIYFTKVFLN